MKRTANTRKHIGEIGVDAGLCWIGDPSYVLHAERPPRSIGATWEQFCDILDEDGQYPVCKQFCYDLGHPGLGIVVSTGHGDGVYPVIAEFNGDGRIARVTVEFIGRGDEPGEA